jgi:hypothetical protein
MTVLAAGVDDFLRMRIHKSLTWSSSRCFTSC